MHHEGREHERADVSDLQEENDRAEVFKGIGDSKEQGPDHHGQAYSAEQPIQPVPAVVQHGPQPQEEPQPGQNDRHNRVCAHYG